jgi:tRNA-binding EMAP/Myf-like protein
MMTGMYSSPNIIRLIESGRMRWAAHATHMGDKRNAYWVSVEDHEERDHLEDLEVDLKIDV